MILSCLESLETYLGFTFFLNLCSESAESVEVFLKFDKNNFCPIFLAKKVVCSE